MNYKNMGVIVGATYCLVGCANTTDLSSEAKLKDNVPTEALIEKKSSEEIGEIANTPLIEISPSEEVTEEEVAYSFYHQELSNELISELEAIAPINPSVITYDDLRHVIVAHYDFNGKIQEGELIVNKSVADEIVDIFKEVFEAKYPIEKIRLVSEYRNDDDLSMEDNNSSAFNFREITGGGGWSNHAYGLAIDINPKNNPYVSSWAVYPTSGANYIDRDKNEIGMIQEGDALHQAFINRGWTWGGDWTELKDYQHFEKE